MFAMLSTDRQSSSKTHSDDLPFFKRVNDVERYSQKAGDFSNTQNFFKAELNQENTPADTATPMQQKNTPANTGCTYEVNYGNPKLQSVPSCGAAVQYDILQVLSKDKKCQKGLKGKQLSEIVTTDNKCYPTTVTTGPPVLLGDNGIPVNPATDTYGINMPRLKTLPDCSWGIGCPQEMKQELYVDGQLSTTNIIKFEICGDSGGCMTKVYFNRLYLGVVGTGIYSSLSMQQQY